MEILSIILQIVILASLLGLGIPFYIKFFLTDNNKSPEIPQLNNRELEVQTKQLRYEIQNAAKQATLEVESKIKESKHLIAELDKKINVLKEISKNLEFLQKFSGKTFLLENLPQSFAEEFEEGLKAKHLTEENISQINIKKNKKPETTFKTFSPADKNNNNLSLEKKRNKIFSLADKGWNVTEIAREANLTKGEVQLILDLRKNQ